jgi:Flp pilus assembly protein TadG
MTEIKSATKRSRFLSRLLRDETGNVIAIMAAAVIPLIGLVGGGVDVSRIYLVKTKLQAACDAGSLMGRRVMGNGTWATSGANARSEDIFDANFLLGEYGTTARTRTFTEAAGVVSGTATAVVPMTLMKVFNRPDETVTVTCRSELAIPSTDVMFVLDVTGSMSSTDTNGVSRISGLKTATKCFYETLAKENISSVSPTACGRTVDPTGGTSADVNMRFGFVPYSVNVNVGKLLPLNYIANNWTYQSREATFATAPGGPVASYGTEGPRSPSGSPTNSPAGAWSSWEQAGSSFTVGSKTYNRKIKDLTKAECATWDSDVPDQNASSAGPITEVSRSPNPLVNPQSTQTITYSQTTGSTTTEYAYDWEGDDDKPNKKKDCRLWSRSRTDAGTTQLYTSTVEVIWSNPVTFAGYTYKPTTFNISGLKDTTNNAWRSSVSLPLGNNGANISIPWDGCIEERQTARVTDSDPSNDWSPVPAGAKDMNIDLAPSTSDATTQWGPMLDDVVYKRYWNGAKTTSNLGPNDFDNDDEGDTDQTDHDCPMPAKLYQEWTPTAFDTYVNTLSPTSYTYHDIGMLWGARLASPTGIFSSVTAPPDVDIQRHMIFMTDGETNPNSDLYNPYGLDHWDRRQNDGTSNASWTWLRTNVDARTQAICSWVKGKNITLWVISFGDDVGSSTETALQTCATAGKFYRAEKASDLIATFNTIAAEISNLRLTS